MTQFDMSEGPRFTLEPDWRSQLADQFRTACSGGPPSELEDFLPLDPSQRVEALMALVPLDMEVRWRWALLSDAATIDRSVDMARVELPPYPRVEDYCRRFQEIGGQQGTLIHLLVEEYRIRSRLESCRSTTLHIPVTVYATSSAGMSVVEP